MKALYWTIALCLALTGCTTPAVRTANNYLHKQSVTTSGHYPAKSAKQIALFQSNQSPQSAYKVIGIATVATRNHFGMQRPEETMHTMMKSLAASIGGDGLINLKPTEKGEWQANVIQFQKILI